MGTIQTARQMLDNLDKNYVYATGFVVIMEDVMRIPPENMDRINSSQQFSRLLETEVISMSEY